MQTDIHELRFACGTLAADGEAVEEESDPGSIAAEHWADELYDRPPFGIVHHAVVDLELGWQLSCFHSSFVDERGRVLVRNARSVQRVQLVQKHRLRPHSLPQLALTYREEVKRR